MNNSHPETHYVRTSPLKKRHSETGAVFPTDVVGLQAPNQPIHPENHWSFRKVVMVTDGPKICLKQKKLMVNNG